MYREDGFDHFYCTSENEKNKAIDEYGYRPKGILGYVKTVGDADHVPLYRAWHPLIRDHFYTTSITEIENVAPKINQDTLKDLIEDQLDDCLKWNAKIYPADTLYYATRKRFAKKIVDDSLVEQLY